MKKIFCFWSHIYLDPNQWWNRLRRWRYSFRFQRTRLRPILELNNGKWFSPQTNRSSRRPCKQQSIMLSKGAFGTLQLRKVSNLCSWWRGGEVGLTGDKQRSSIYGPLGNSTDLGIILKTSMRSNAVRTIDWTRNSKQESDNERKPFNRPVFK